MTSLSLEDKLQEVRSKDPRYKPKAYQFLFRALDYTVRKLYGTSNQNHVTGQKFLEGIIDYSVCKFGLLAKTVFTEWGIGKSEDYNTSIANMVYNLIDAELMGKDDADRKTDFLISESAVDLKREIDVSIKDLDYNQEKDEWNVIYKINHQN